jgi:hypothetical protein
VKESFSHISHTFLMALRKRAGICLCGLSWSPNQCSLSLSSQAFWNVPSRNSSPEKECEFWICFFNELLRKSSPLLLTIQLPLSNLQRLALNYLQEKPDHNEPAAPTSPLWRMNGQ